MRPPSLTFTCPLGPVRVAGLSEATGRAYRITMDHVRRVQVVEPKSFGRRGGRTRHSLHSQEVARVTGLEPATSGVTGRHSNQLSYTRIPRREAMRRGEGRRLGGPPGSVKRSRRLKCSASHRAGRGTTGAAPPAGTVGITGLLGDATSAATGSW